MAIGAAILSVLGAIASIAGYFGFQKIVDTAEDMKAHSSGMTTDQIMSKTRALLKQIQDKSTTAYNQAVQKINSIPDGANIIGGGLTQEFRRQRKQLYNDADSFERRIRNASSLQERADTYASQPSSYKNSTAGSRDYVSIQHDIEKFVRDNSK